MEVLPRARHRHVEQPALRVDLLGFACGHVQGYTAVHEIEIKTVSHSYRLAEWMVDKIR
jgi:hypothetical protein